MFDSSFRHGVSSFRHVVSAYKYSLSIRCFLTSTRRIASSIRRLVSFVVSSCRFDSSTQRGYSLRSWRDFARESFCFGSEAVNESGKAVRGLVKSPGNFTRGFAARENPSRALWRLCRRALARSRIPPATQAREAIIRRTLHELFI